MDGDMDAPVPISQSRHDRYILAHAVLGSIATLIIFPAAILVGRYLRTWRHWNIVHMALNAFGVILIIVTFALGVSALDPTPNEFTGPGSDLHHKLGLAVFIIVLVQAILGLPARFTKRPPHNYVVIQSKRSPLRILHILLGIATAALLYTQVYTGFDEWDMASESQTMTPRGVRIAFWVLFAIEVFLYVAGWPLMEILGRKRRDAHPEEVREKA